MAYKYAIPARRRTTVAVDRDVLVAIKLFAQMHGMTVAEATYFLIRKGIAAAMGLEREGEER